MPRSLRVREERKSKVNSALLRNGYISQRRLGEDLGFSQSTISNFLTCKPVDYSYFTEICEKLALDWRDIADLELPEETSPPPSSSPPPTADSPLLPSNSLEYPEGQVPLNSPFYVERLRIEQSCYEEIRKPGSLIRIKAPQQMGKSSLLVRLLQHSETLGDVTVTIDLQLAEAEFLTSLNSFLRWFCDILTSELGKGNPELQHKLLHNLDEHWNLAQRIGAKHTCKDYFEQYLFPEIKQPLTLALETVDRLFEYPGIYKDFFGLLRSLHEEGKRHDSWKKLRLVIVHSTEAYVKLDLNQSPFNVGLSIDLPEFTHKQVTDLAQRHQLNWSDTEVKDLMDMVGGHPFLIRLALYKIASQEITLAELLQTAPTTEGIYSSHLRHLESLLDKDSELKTAMREVVNSSTPVFLKTKLRFKLHSMGLVQLLGNEVILRCKLYSQYFHNCL